MIALQCHEDIPERFRETPVAKLVYFHNLGQPYESFEHPEILIGKCMDYRVNLRVPPGFAYKIRSGGCNLRHQDFQVAYAVAVGGVKAIALIGHNDCAMVDLEKKRDQFIRGITAHSSWPPGEADEFFQRHAAEHSLCVETGILREQAKKYSSWFPRLPVATLLYQVEDQMLYLL